MKDLQDCLRAALCAQEEEKKVGRLPYKEKRKYDIQQLWSNHKEITRRLVLGQSSVEIASELGVTPAVVSYTKNSTLGKEKIAELEARRDDSCVEVARQIKSLAPIALGVIEGILQSDSVAAVTKMKAAQDILDRAGHGAVKVVQTQNTTLHFTGADLEEIKKRARASGVCVDVQAEPLKQE